jgi:hypothetical protein
MINEKYKIHKKIFDGKRIVAYDIINLSDKIIRVSKNDLIGLILRGLIVNARVTKTGDVIGFKTKLSELPSVKLRDKGRFILVYHGSAAIVKKPKYGFGKVKNDFGPGFYTTRSEEMASEWSVLSEDVVDFGYKNCYKLYVDNLNIIGIGEDIALWLAVLAKFRGLESEDRDGRVRKFVSMYYNKQLELADVIIGWRADDDIYRIVEDFLNNGISLETARKVLLLGGFGKQFVLKSKKAFDNIEFVRADKVKVSEYRLKARKRSELASRNYYGVDDDRSGTLLRDLIR